MAAVLVTVAAGQNADKPAPTYSNISYGSHERNVLDLWRADSAKATPFVVYIHGGGFSSGSKESIRAPLIRELLAAGISVAAINYRFYRQAPLPASMLDCRRAVQFLRSKSTEWNLDPKRVGATGGSAGAVASLYLAFHDEMADARNADPVLRESSRLTCVATTAAQTTLEIAWWHANIPGWPKGPDFKEDASIASRWGMRDEATYRSVVNGYSAMHLASRDDPPVWMSYGMGPNDPPPADAKQAYSWALHHVNFGIALKKQMDALGVEAHLVYPGGPKDTPLKTLGAFFTAKLRAKE